MPIMLIHWINFNYVSHFKWLECMDISPFSMNRIKWKWLFFSLCRFFLRLYIFLYFFLFTAQILLPHHSSSCSFSILVGFLILLAIVCSISVYMLRLIWQLVYYLAHRIPFLHHISHLKNVSINIFRFQFIKRIWKMCLSHSLLLSNSSHSIHLLFDRHS